MPRDFTVQEEISPPVVISILNWNGWRETIECLKSVRKLNYPNYLAVIVDNGSADDSADKIKAWAEQSLGSGHILVDYHREIALQGGEERTEAALGQNPSPARLVLIRNEDNLGFAGGNNVTIQYALRRSQPADYVFLLNNDATVDPDCLRHLLQVGRQAQAGIMGAVIKDSESGHVFFTGWVGSLPLLRQFFSPLFSFRLGLPNPEEGFQVSYWVSGAGMLVARDVLEAVRESTGHYFDDALFLYEEELQLCGQARRLGYRTVVVSRALVYHREASASGGPANPILSYYCTRNRVRVAGLLVPWPLRMLFPAFHIPIALREALRQLLRGNHRAALAILLGLVDGYLGVGGKWKYHDQEVRRSVAGWVGSAPLSGQIPKERM